MAYNSRRIAAAAEKVQLVIVPHKTTKELYGYYAPSLDMEATLRRVALFALGSGKAEIPSADKMVAIDILDGRFEDYESRCQR